MIAFTSERPLLALIAALFIGFSVCSAVLLAGLLNRFSGIGENLVAHWAARVLLLALAGLQIAHFYFFRASPEFVHSHFYLVLLFSVAPSFYFLNRELLSQGASFKRSDWLHALPVLIAPFLSFGFARPLAFLVGGGYVCWLGWLVYRLRAQRQRFRYELTALGLLFALSVLVVVLGFLLPAFSEALFLKIYSVLIGLIFFTVLYILLRFPDISIELAEAVRATYLESTLGQVDCERKLEALAALMEQERVYRNENLNLSWVAERLELSPHQLSELINTRLNKGFSRYIRELRVAEAKRQLIEEPAASVLSISLAVGFSSQSNFYAAFKEIEGIAPGQFRKNQTD